MKINLGKHKFQLLIFVSSLVAFFSISYYSNFAYDDFNYKFIYNETSISHDRVASLSDIVVSQYNHYFVHSGRILIHAIVQFFLMFDSRVWFDIANTIVFALFQLAILMLSSQKKISDISYPFYAILVLMLWFVVPGHNYCMFWLSGSVNYLWSTTAGLFLLYLSSRIYRQNYTNPYSLILLFFTGLFLNATHEVISIAISVALFVHLLVNRRKLNRGVLALYAGAFLSTLVTASSPANFRLAAVSTDANHPPLQTVVASNESHLTILLVAISALIILSGLFAILLFFRRAQFFRIVKENYTLLIAIFVSLCFAYSVNAFNQRAIFPAVTMAVVVLLRVLREFEFIIQNRIVKVGLVCAFLAVIAEFAKVIPELKANKIAYSQLESEINRSPKEVTLFSSPHLKKNRFICFTGLGNQNRNWISNEGMSRLFGRKYMVFLPNEVVAKLKSVETAKTLRLLLYFPKQNLIFVNVGKDVTDKVVAGLLNLECIYNNDVATRSVFSPNVCSTGTKCYLFFYKPLGMRDNTPDNAQITMTDTKIKLNIHTN